MPDSGKPAQVPEEKAMTDDEPPADDQRRVGQVC